MSDGITMGTEGMRASLVSRELIADSIELVASSIDLLRRNLLTNYRGIGGQVHRGTARALRTLRTATSPF